jgi:hypothetical protein
MERLREEKDQEIMILQEGMDSTIEQLNEAQQVIFCTINLFLLLTLVALRTKALWMRLLTPRLIPSSSITERS